MIGSLTSHAICFGEADSLQLSNLSTKINVLILFFFFLGEKYCYP